MRNVVIPSRRVAAKRVEVPGHVRCIGCEKDLSSGFNYTGSIIEGLRFRTQVGMESTPIKISGSMEAFNKVYPILVGGETILTERKCGYYPRKKGPLCDSCSAQCAKTITDRGGNKHQVVKVDPRPGFIGMILRDGL